MFDPILVSSLPTARQVRERIGHLLRELKLAKKLLSAATLADEFRAVREAQAKPGEVLPCR